MNHHQKQNKIAIMQFIVDLPTFIFMLVLAFLSKSLIVWMDVLDSLGYVLRATLVALISKKLSQDLRYEFNYGYGKIEAMVGLLCDGIIFGGLSIMVGVCVHNLQHPAQTNDAVLGVLILKLITIALDLLFMYMQGKLLKEQPNAIAQSVYDSYLGALLFDCVTMASLVIIWLFRNNPITWYFSPVISIFLALYLMLKCINRFKSAINELTDRTLPEEIQIKILKVLTNFYDQYSQLHFVKSRKHGSTLMVDLVLSFDPDTSSTHILELKKQIQDELNKSIGNCLVHIDVS